MSEEGDEVGGGSVVGVCEEDADVSEGVVLAGDGVFDVTDRDGLANVWDVSVDVGDGATNDVDEAGVVEEGAGVDDDSAGAVVETAKDVEVSARDAGEVVDGMPGASVDLKVSQVSCSTLAQPTDHKAARDRDVPPGGRHRQHHSTIELVHTHILVPVISCCSCY